VVSGPLYGEIVDAGRFVVRNMKTAAFKTMGRTNRPQYDMAAVFEAVANAVAHRDYSVHGSKIRLQLFEDRLELYSPGAIANSMAIDSLRYRQSARNEAVCSLLAKCPAPDESWLVTHRTNIMERRGEGVPIILDNSTLLSGREPEYRLFDNEELLLTIYAAAPETDDAL
ncbi:MAG: transcriptional regulator, partial [Gemmatimonadetes bacterium]|nr:transcriptional regulator [Gemmatimonadota bacterium]